MKFRKLALVLLLAAVVVLGEGCDAGAIAKAAGGAAIQSATSTAAQQFQGGGAPPQPGAAPGQAAAGQGAPAAQQGAAQTTQTSRVNAGANALGRIIGTAERAVRDAGANLQQGRQVGLQGGRR